jgi:ubiquinone/menaquinone biosynthesis C-methylase UbiE
MQLKSGVIVLSTNLNKLPGVHPAPNIQTNPNVYEIENLAADSSRLIEAAMWDIASWQNAVVLDLGAGTGFHLPFFHQAASHVIAVEPHGSSRLLAMARCVSLHLERVSIMAGSAEQIYLPDASIDICHARFAYFFAPNCMPGLRELARVMRPGGTTFIIDNDLSKGTFASWLQKLPMFQTTNSTEIEGFWADQGFSLTRIASEWQFATRTDLEAVVSLEFGAELAAQLLENHQGTRVEYHYCLYHHRY